MDIQKVSLEEIVQLEKISRQTFCETFSSGNTEENMNKYLDEVFSSANLSIVLNDKKAEFYFAN